MNLPIVSVVITVYNDENYIATAIESILSQTFQDYELIVVDDGSTDATASILDKYLQTDKRIHVYRIENSGTTIAANVGLKMANGKYIARLDSDDISFPHRLMEQVQYLEENPVVALVGGSLEFIDENGVQVGVRNIKAKDPKKFIYHRNIYQHSDVMFKKEIVNKVGGYREKFRNSQDLDLWLRISEIADIAKTNNIIGQWRINPGGYTIARAKEQMREVKLAKEFARQRRKYSKDTYDLYVPPAKPRHRERIRQDEYNLIIGAVLLQSVRVQESRERIMMSIKSSTSLLGVSLYLLTYLPKWTIRMLFSLRSCILDHM
jgi:glycosyltransferase involved in cell wall biosynthesis